MADPLPVVIADTSAMIAYFNDKDDHHVSMRDGFAQTGHLVLSPCVLTELDYLIATRQGPTTARSVLATSLAASQPGGGKFLRSPPFLLTAHAILGDYPAIGLADAINVALASEFRTDVIATLDRRHFRMIRPLTRHDAFRLLPDDVPGTQ
jgi:predicted nucleic acid-binding protein